MKPKPNTDWLAALESCMAMDSPGPEWKTRRQVEKEFNMTRGPANRVLSALIKAGKIEMKMFAVAGLNKKRHATQHYRLK